MAVHVITGDDESLVLTAVTELVHRLVGSGDRSLMVDDFDGDDYVLAQVTDAAQTPPFLSDRRVVIARGASRFGADEVDDLARYLTDPLESTDLVLVQGSGRLPKVLGEALKAANARFDAMDTNKDGTVTAGERMDYMKAKMRDWKSARATDNSKP